MRVWRKTPGTRIYTRIHIYARVYIHIYVRRNIYIESVAADGSEGCGKRAARAARSREAADRWRGICVHIIYFLRLTVWWSFFRAWVLRLLGERKVCVKYEGGGLLFW